MIRRIVILTVSALCLFFTGCATVHDMAVIDDNTVKNQTKGPIYLMTVTVRNDHHKSYQPKVTMVDMQKFTPQGQSDGVELYSIDDLAVDGAETAEGGNSYLVRMDVPPGKHAILGLFARSGIFPVAGSFFTPLNSKFTAPASGIFYLGHVQAVIRERQENEFRAGGLFPLIDQGVVGASGGTWEIQITDRWEADQAKFVGKFPALKNATVQKDILPPFDRAAVQKWWDDCSFGDMPKQ